MGQGPLSCRLLPLLPLEVREGPGDLIGADQKIPDWISLVAQWIRVHLPV